MFRGLLQRLKKNHAFVGEVLKMSSHKSHRRNSNSTRNHAPLFFTFCSSYALYADARKIEENKNRKIEKSEPVDKELYRQTCKENDEALKKLMIALIYTISDISNRYRENLSKQMKLTIQSVKNKNIGETSEELGAYREEAKKLKEEINDWKNYVDKVGHIVLQHAVTSYKAGNETARELFVKDFRKLDTCMKEQMYANQMLEMELLILSRDCFLQYIQEDNFE